MESEKSSVLLKYKIDRYKAATLDASSSPLDAAEFEKLLINTMNQLRQENARGVWLQLNIEQSIFIPAAVKYGYILGLYKLIWKGFEYHHAKDEHMLLTYWIPQNEPNKLPHYATHFMGVGGVVINEDTDEILVIQERISVIENFDFWKIPGGLVDPGEYLTQAVEREVFEETGIKAQFQCILGFREKLVYKWGQPDIYFVCLLKSLTFDINIDQVEIQNAKWMKIDEYFQSYQFEFHKKMTKLIGYKRLGGLEKIKNLDQETLFEMAGFNAEQFSIKFGKYESSDNIFYYSNTIKALSEAKPNL